MSMIRKTLFLLAVLCATAAAQQPALSSAGGGPTKHKVEEFAVPSKLYGRARRVWVYTPAGYDPARKIPYDLVVAFDGIRYGDSGNVPLTRILEKLTAKGKLPPMVALLIDNGGGAARISELANHARFAQALADEIMPWLHRGWNVTADPQHVIVTGSSAGGLGAAYVAYKCPDLFGNVLSQSGAFWRGNEGSNDPPYEWLTQQFKDSPKLPLRFYLEVGALETAQAVGTGPVFIEANRRLRDVLQAKGYPVFYKEVRGARHDAEHWQKELDDGLLWLAGGWRQ